MHYSGILVTASPDHLTTCIDHLEALAGVEVFHRDLPRGKLVVVQETATLADQEAGFRRLGSLPHVLAVELVYHYRDDEPVTVSGETGLSATREG